MKGSKAVAGLLLACVVTITALVQQGSARTVGVFTATPADYVSPPSHRTVHHRSHRAAVAATAQLRAGSYSAYMNSAPTSTYADYAGASRTSPMDPQARRMSRKPWSEGTQDLKEVHYQHVFPEYKKGQASRMMEHERRKRRVRSRPQRRSVLYPRERRIWDAIDGVKQMLLQLSISMEQSIVLQHIQQTQLHLERRRHRTLRRLREAERQLRKLAYQGEDRSKQARDLKAQQIKLKLQLLDLRQLAASLRDSWEKIARRMKPANPYVKRYIDKDVMDILQSSDRQAADAYKGDGARKAVLRRELAKLQQKSLARGATKQDERKPNFKSSWKSSGQVCANLATAKMREIRRELGGLKPEDSFYRHPWFSLKGHMDLETAEKALMEMQVDTVTWAHDILDDLELAQLEHLARQLRLTGRRMAEPRRRGGWRSRRDGGRRSVGTFSTLEDGRLAQRNGHFIFQMSSDNSDTEEDEGHDDNEDNQ